ncbi:class I SAM-dependent methyltransferase [Patescibacteria group bacterium]|nr:class I SAM-dependent methyltransferase [Patescibacteria group bacterium]
MEKCKICYGQLVRKYKNLFDNRHGYPGRFYIYQCRNCGFMETFPQLRRNKLTQIYSKYYPRQNIDIKQVALAGKNIPSPTEIYWKGLATSCHFATKKLDKVLDIGSGVGYSLVEIRKLGGEAWGIDPDNNAKKIAQRLKLKFHKAFLENCPFPKNYFDLITASQVIEHESNPLEFLNLCKEFLKDKGRIILSFPNTDSLYRKIWGKNWLHWHIPYHLNHFNKKSFRILARNSGLKIVSIKTITPNLWTILQIKSLLNNPKEGTRDMMWNGVVQNSKDSGKKISLLNTLLQRLLPQIEKLLVTNRFVDFLGLGESFVIELKVIKLRSNI